MRRAFRSLALCLVSGVSLPPAAFAAPAAGQPAKPAAKSEKDKPAAKLYRYKGQRVTGKGPSQLTTLLLEDPVSGKSSTAALPKDDPAVTEAAKAFEAGAFVEVQTKRAEGRTVVASIAKADLLPGEERAGMYVLVDWDKQKQQDGKPMMGVKLRKFGREFLALVPLTRNKETDDWAAPWGVEHALDKVERGQVLEVVLLPGNPPLVKDMMLYRPPEQGTFVEFAQVENEQGQQVAAFKMLQGDGVTVTVTLPGVERRQGTTKYLQPDPRMLQAVRQIKPDSIVEITLQPGDRYILRDIRVVKAPKPTTPAAKD